MTLTALGSGLIQWPKTLRRFREGIIIVIRGVYKDQSELKPGEAAK